MFCETTEMPEKSRQAIPSIKIELIDSGRGHAIQTWHFENRSPVTIGRSRDQDIQLPDRYVSRKHASIRYENGAWLIASLGRNGIVMHGRLIDEVPIDHDTSFRLGEFGPVFRFSEEGIDVGDTTLSMPAMKLTPHLYVDEEKRDRDLEQLGQNDVFQALTTRGQ